MQDLRTTRPSTDRAPPGGPTAGLRERPDETARELERLARQHEQLLLRRALRLCRNRHDAEDLVHDTYERAYKKLHLFQPGTNLLVWLYTVMHHIFIDRCRKRVPEVRSPADTDNAVAPAAEEPGDAPIWARVTRPQFASAVASLNPDFRVVYELHALKGMSYDDIAAQLQIPKGTVGTRLFRARGMLKAALLKALAGAEEDK